MQYNITINLANNSRLVKTMFSPYYMSGAKTDKVVFDKNKIYIEACRSKRFSSDDILFNIQNSIYNQLYKSLLYHYAANGSSSAIQSISVNLKDSKSEEMLFTKYFTIDNQPFALNDPPVPFDLIQLEHLMQEDDDSYQFRLIMAHWMSAQIQSNQLNKLECIWRTFERLCTYLRHRSISEKPNISEGIKLMIHELTTNSRYYSNSSALVSSYTYETLRRFLWHDMIENNYKKGGSLQKYQDYVQYLVSSYSDSRVIQLMFDMRHYREADLKSHNLYSSMKHDCLNKLSVPVKNDIDVVTTLCCNYAYYIRNILFHGQSLVKSSIFEDIEDKMQINELAKILTLTTVELINNFDRL